MDKMTTQTKGITTELRCQLDFVSRGYQVLLPLGEGCVYDVAVALGNKIIRIQCKTARWATDTKESNTCFHISMIRQTTNTKCTIKHKYTPDEIDYFYTWFNGQSYLIPIIEDGPSVMRFRYEIPKYGSASDTNLESEYRFDNFFPPIVEDVRAENHNAKRAGGHCIKCGAPTYKEGSMCIACKVAESSFRTIELREMPIRLLKEKICNETFTDIGKQYGVTENSVKKICKMRGLPYRRHDINNMSDEDWEKLLLEIESK